MDLRIVLAGTRSFGRAAYDLMSRKSGVEIVGVVSPEPVDGEKWDALTARAVSEGETWAGRMDAGWVAERDADLIVCAHSHAYVGRKSRGATRLGAIGYHPSLLPRHRGRDAVEWTVRMGDPVAGGSVYWFDDGVDTGPIAAQDWCFVARGETASELWREKLFPMGLSLLEEAVDDIRGGQLYQVRQDEKYATWEPSLDGKRLHRPELLELGSGPAGYTVIANKR